MIKKFISKILGVKPPTPSLAEKSKESKESHPSKTSAPNPKRRRRSQHSNNKSDKSGKTGLVSRRSNHHRTQTSHQRPSEDFESSLNQDSQERGNRSNRSRQEKFKGPAPQTDRTNRSKSHSSDQSHHKGKDNQESPSQPLRRRSRRTPSDPSFRTRKEGREREPQRVTEKIQPPTSQSQKTIPQKASQVSIFSSEKTFHEMGLSSQLSDCLTAHNFISPSKAQEDSIPIVLEKKNLICSSETGSGKTLAFVIPILERFLRQEVHGACILTPTREIAIQIESVMKPLSDTLGITTGLAIGGMDMLLQKKTLREYPQVLIATPGRLVDVASQGLVWLNYTSMVVLDEVDRMLDMGFEKEISTLFSLFDPKAQILMFTATMDKQLEKLSQNYVKEYQLVTIGETMKTKSSIEHLFISLPTRERYQTLKSLLQKNNKEKVLIFFNSIDETINVFRQLKKDHFSRLNCLHSRKSQDERNQVMTAFRNDRINHLLTTDVLARGVDIPMIDIVINYELPRDSEDYVHRIGRTGRGDLLGKALSFVNKKDEIKLKRIKQLVKSDQGFNFISSNELKNF